MKSSRADGQLSLPPTEVRRSERTDAAFRNSEEGSSRATAFRKSEQDTDGFRSAEYELASGLFDEALTAARIENGEVAALCGVSESLVHKWRSRDARACPSFVQLLLLPPTFHLELHRAMNRRFGYGRQLLRRVLDDLGDLAIVTEGTR